MAGFFKERRKKFLINRPLQFRYMAYISGSLFVIAVIILGSLYFGIWGGILDSFSDQKVREQLLIATRLTEYESARIPVKKETPSLLNFFKESEKLSQRQKEVFKEILDETNKKLLSKLIFLLILIAWGSIYISHKIAGPLFRFYASLQEVDNRNLTTRIHLRKNDEAQFLAAKLNYTVENLDFSISRIKNIIKMNEKNPELMLKRLNEELSNYKTSVDT